MGVTETLRILLTIFLSTACIQNVRLFGVYDVHWPFLIEIHTAPLKRFVPSSVLQAVRTLRNALAALTMFLSTLENCNGSWRIELLRKGFWGRGTVPGCVAMVSLMLCVSAYTYI